MLCELYFHNAVTKKKKKLEAQHKKYEQLLKGTKK